jgi:hypothetical protein
MKLKIAGKALPGITGHSYVPVDLDRLQEFKAEAYRKGVGYKMGAKDPTPGDGEVDFSRVDCSGWVRTMLIYCTHGILAPMPDGSWQEAGFLDKMGFKEKVCRVPMDCGSTGLADEYLRVAVHYPGGRGGDAVGHIALFAHGHSVESYAGRGPGERPWDHKWFLEHWDRVFVIGPMISPWIY